MFIFGVIFYIYIYTRIDCEQTICTKTPTHTQQTVKKQQQHSTTIKTILNWIIAMRALFCAAVFKANRRLNDKTPRFDVGLCAKQ